MRFAWTSRDVLRNANQNVLMGRLMAIPAYENYYFEQIVKVAMLAGGDGGWLQQEATREYNQIQQAAYADPKQANGYYWASFIAATTLVSTPRPRWWCRLPGDRTPFVLGDIAAYGYQLPSNYPNLNNGGVVNAAAGVATAAGGLASIYGTNMGSGANTTVYINGYAAPVFYASPSQFNVQVPWEATGLAPFGVIVNGAPSNVQFATVSTYSPGVFMVSSYRGRDYSRRRQPGVAPVRGRE